MKSRLIKVHLYRCSLAIVLIILASCAWKQGPVMRDVAEPKFHQLSNGMKVFILEDPSIPTFRLSLYAPAGSVFDLPGKAGLAALTAQSLRAGGTQSLKPEQVDLLIDNEAASIGFAVKGEYVEGSIACLKDDRRDLLDLFARILRSPRFDGKALETSKRQFQIGLRQSKEQVSEIADTYFAELLYGEESPWSRVPTEQSLHAINRKDLLRFYQEHYHPDQVILGISGDFKTSELIRELEASLGLWKGSTRDAVQWPVHRKADAHVYFTEKQARQAAIYYGHLSTDRNNQDKYALMLANFVLGGSGALTSRLGLEVRSRGGLAYSVWSRYSFGRVPGIFAMVAQTEASQVLAVTQTMHAVLQKLIDTGVSHEELIDAKRALLTSMLFSYESRFAIADHAALFEFYGYEKGYLKNFSESIAKVRVIDVKRVLKKYFDTDALSLYIVGPNDQLGTLRDEWPDLKIKVLP
jgi:zinc protease